jgi:acyl-CoA synthetase (AMP-forming)/AMP-acid ligase II
MISHIWRSIDALLLQAAERFGDREFLRFEDASLTFAAASHLSEQIASGLFAQGIKAGDRVAILMTNVSAWPLCWLAAVRIGAAAVPINPACGESDLGHALQDSGTTLLIASEELLGLADRVITALNLPVEVQTAKQLLEAGSGRRDRCATAPSHRTLASLQYTSGTTGLPKACMLSHAYWLRTAWLMALHSELTAEDVVLTAQAFSYIDPQWKMLMSLVRGAKLVVLPRFSASGFWDSAREHRATVTYVLGSMPTLLYKQPPSPKDRDNAMRLVLCSAIPRHLHSKLESRWGAPWREVYGSTESGLDLIASVRALDTVGTGAMGLPPEGKELRVVDDDERSVLPGQTGQIVVRGQPMMDGYWNYPDVTAEVFRHGWFHTGDRGYVDQDGYIHHAGRLKDLIRRGGANISPAEVETVLEAHPDVNCAAVVGIPDPLFDEVPKAFLRLRAGCTANTETALSIIRHARKQLARFKVPVFLEFVDDFPTTPSARIRKSVLSARSGDPRAGTFDVLAATWR